MARSHRKDYRADKMAGLYRDGLTLQQIGEQFGITRERVRQILREYTDITADMGGRSVQVAKAQAGREAEIDSRYLSKFDCSFSEWKSLRDIGRQMMREGATRCRTPLNAYTTHKNNAIRRGVGFNLTLWQWWTIWQDSGHWDSRGRSSGEYVMCRKGDQGAYEVGNVFIALCSRNSSEANRKHPLPIGVRYVRGAYVAYRMTQGKNRYLGRFSTPAHAHAAYLAAAPRSQEAA